MGSSQQGTTISQSSSSPWSGVQPYITTGLEQAGQQLATPNEYYPGSTVVPFSQQTEAGLQAQEGRALQGSPLTQAAQGEMQKVLGGEYLNQDNPAFSAMSERIRNEIRPGLDSQFAGAGRYGGAGHQEMMGRTYADAIAPLAYQNYAAERGNMQQAMQQAPALANQDYFDINKLRETGTTREGLARDTLAADMDRYNYGQQEPRDRLAQYMALIGGGRFGQDTTTQTPYYTNTAGNIGGGLMGAAGILGSLKGLFG